MKLDSDSVSWQFGGPKCPYNIRTTNSVTQSHIPGDLYPQWSFNSFQSHGFIQMLAITVRHLQHTHVINLFSLNSKSQFGMLKRSIKIYKFVISTIPSFFMFCWLCILIIFVMKTNLMHCLSLIYFITQPLHVSGIFTAHHRELFIVYVQQWNQFHPDPASCQSPERITRTNCCTYTVNTSWWWAINMSETCRGCLMK
jgi:uncharacterized membrane protein YecN with MAPEG domain